MFASTLMAGGTITARAGTGRIIGSDLHGEQGVDLQADAGDFTVDAAQITRSSYSYDKEITVSLGDSVIKGAVNPALLVQVKDGRATVHIADAHYREDQSTAHDTWMRGTNISSGNDIDIRADAGNVNIIGSTLAADTNGTGNGDVNLSAAQKINIIEATDTARSNSQHISGDAELSLVVQHQAVEVVKAYERLEEAKEQLEESKRQYKDYERNLEQLEQSLRQLEQDLADKKPGVHYADVVELRALIDEVKDNKEWYQAGIALAALNLVSATNALATQIVALSTSGQTLGFNAGLQLDIDASQTQSEYQSTTAVASTVSGQNIRLNTGNGNTAGTETNIRGSQLLASNNIAITTGDLNVTASKNTYSSSSETQHGHVTAQMTVYGAAGGASVNASFDRSQNSARETTHNNSLLLADRIDITTSGDTTLRGATVRAESELNANIQGDLIVESVQDRSSSRNSSAGVSGGFSLGGDGETNQGNDFTRHIQNSNDIGALSGINAGAKSGNGMSSSRETVLTSLTSGGTANINVQNHTQITGALIATTDENGNDLNQLNLSTHTLGFADLRDRNISSQTSAGLSINFNMQPVNSGNGQTPSDATSASQAAAQPTVATGANGEELKPGTTNIVYNNSQQNNASNTLATLGHGTITVGGTVLEQNGELTEAGKAENSALAGINRDTTDTSKELWNSDYSQELDATIDNRLLNPSRWGEIGQDYVDAAEASKKMFNAAVDTVETYRRELAAMGDDLPEHLGGLLGARGEQLVDDLIRAGLSDQTIEKILADDSLTASLLGLNIAMERCTTQEACTTVVQPTDSSRQENSPKYDENGDLIVEILHGRQITPLQAGVENLGRLYGELQQLALVDPQAARAVELAIRTFTGGPFKVALSESLSALTAYAVNNTVGNEFDRMVNELMIYSGAKVQGVSSDTYERILAWEQSNPPQEGEDGADNYSLTLDGIRLSGFIIGSMGSVVGSGSGSTNRVAGNGGRGSNSSHDLENISNSQSIVKDETGGTLGTESNVVPKGTAVQDVPEGVPYFRVQGGGSGTATSRDALTVNADGSVSISPGCTGAICVSVEGPEHASYYLTNKRPDGSVLVFEVDRATHNKIMENLVPQQGNAGAGVKLTDTSTPGISIELNRAYSELMTTGSSNGRVLTQKEFFDEFGGN